MPETHAKGMITWAYIICRIVCHRNPPIRYIWQASVSRKMSEHQSPQLSRKHQRPASWMGSNTAMSSSQSKDSKGSQLHKIVSESRMMQQHRIEHKSLSTSRVEGTRSHHGSMVTLLDNNQGGVSGLLAQFFWTSASLLESDYEQEFSMAMRLLNKV